MPTDHNGGKSATSCPDKARTFSPDCGEALHLHRSKGGHDLRIGAVDYAVETSARFESDWMPYQAIVHAEGGHRGHGVDGTEFRTTTCAQSRAETSIEYQREAGTNEIDVSTVIRIAAGNDVRTLHAVHNDNTTISFCGAYRAAWGRKIRGRTGPSDHLRPLQDGGFT